LKWESAAAEAQRELALAQYEKTIQTAFKEVSDALISRQRVRESREKQEELVAALEDRTRLAYVRYRGGVDTQLNALDADRDLFQAELTLSGIRLNELLAVVDLYKALGRWLEVMRSYRPVPVTQSSAHQSSPLRLFLRRPVQSDAAE